MSFRFLRQTSSLILYDAFFTRTLHRDSKYGLNIVRKCQDKTETVKRPARSPWLNINFRRNFCATYEIGNRFKFVLYRSDVSQHFKHQRYASRHFSNQPGNRNTKSNPKFDPNKLLYAVYVSIGIGVCLLLAIIKREVDRVRNRMKGIEEITDSVFGRRALMVKYKDVVLPIFTSRILKDIENFEVREDDIWLVSYPRSGTTWLQEIIYLIQTNLDFSEAKKTSIEDRFPYLEYHYPGLNAINNMKSPRLIKTHLPLRLLPNDITVKTPKVIYIARNPKDVLVSYYHFTKMLRPITRFNGTFEDFYDRFLHNKLCYSPWWRHVKEFWDIKEQQNILFISYEDMQKDIHKVIHSIAHFIGKSLTEQEVKRIAEHCKFSNMQKNDTVNFYWWTESGVRDNKESEFLRKGKVGDWKSQLTEEMNKHIDRMVIMKFYGSGLDFQYDIGQDIEPDKEPDNALN